MSVYKTVPAYSVTWDGDNWTQTLTTGPDFMLMTYDEVLFSLGVQGNAYVDGEVCMALRVALHIVPDTQEVAA